MLFHSSEESPGVEGLKLLDGTVQRIPSHYDFNVPHIGWNSLHRTNYTPDFMKTFFDSSGTSVSDFYFVHSYFALPSSHELSIATISHPNGPLDVAFSRKNIYAFQFHPEKSGPAGYRLLSHVLDQ